MASHRRFEDEQYKNWLKTTMSLQLLRTSLGDFLENETETFHNSLKNKLKQATCKNGCTVKANYRNKVPEVCPECKPWGEEIFKNHNNKRGEIYWNNSKPCLWSSRKWEVAKVYMPRGNKNHHAVDQFDISAILNLMNVCSHFKNFVKEQIIKEVTHVRNQMMHSADMKVAKEDMQKHLSKILDFVKHLQDRVPHLNNLKDEISQLEEAELNIMVEGQDTSQKDAAMNLMNKQQMLDLEQQVLKEKIEALASRLEEDKDLNNEELQRMKEFLDQNKDLLEQLGPHMEKFNAIQVKVEQHDQQLTDLTETVDQLVKKTEEPAFSADTVKYKNHLFEEAKENKWPDPMFNVQRKSQGYIGQVVVNGQTFTGCLVHPNKTAAHQEVSKIALEQLHLQSKEEGSLSLHEDDQSAANSLFFAEVKVPVKTEFKGPEAGSSEAAVLEAYKSLAQALNLGDAGAGCPSDDARERVCDFFRRARCDPPKECVSTTDGKFMCTLCIDGNLTFQNPEGMSKKRQAEIAAAKEALLRLARVLDWDLAGVNENYKGRLQEMLVKQGQELPSYQPVFEPVHTEPSHRGAESEKSLASVPIPQAAVSVSNMESQARASVDSSQFPLQVQMPKTEDPAPVVATVQPSESNLTQRSDTDVPVVHHNTAVGQAIIPAMPIHTSETSVPSANSLVFVGVTVPVKTEFKGPEAGSSEAAFLEAYKSLAQALNLGDAGAGCPSDDSRERVCDFFSRACCDPPKECVSTTDGKFMCTLCIDGNLTFQNPEGMSKKRQAENAAAKEALHRLARVLDWDLAGVNENYKGRLQEILVKQGQELPSYQPVFEPVHTEPSHRGAESEKSLASVPIPQAAVSVSNMESQATASVDSSLFPLPVQMPKTETPAPVVATVQPTESNFTQRSDSDVPVVHHNTAAGQAIIPAMPIHTSESSVPSASSLVFVGVTVPVKTEFKGPEAGSSEAAVLEAYKSLALALNLGDAGAGCPSDDARERVCDFFSRARCDPPKECVSITDGKFMCTLCIDGNLTFQNPEGMSKKKQAENAAAKEALHRLARVLDWDLEGVTENHKGRLQEILVKQGQEPPSYQPVIEPVHTEPSHRGAESEKRKSPDDHTQHLPDVKKPKRESPDFGRVLRMFGLQPTSVSCENFNVKEWYILTVEINLVNFTYTNQQGCNNKKEAIRKAYLIFGQATGICQPCTEEIQASMAVKQHFSQNSFSLPTEEVVEKEQKKFYCSLKVESCRLSFEGQGESEEAARLEACKQALSQLGQLFDYKSPSSSDTASEERLTFLLEDAGQGPPAFRKADVLYTADAQLNLNDFALACKGQSSKKLAQRQLCAQILVLLGQKETETCSERNQVDDWFKQKQLPQPVFADTKGSGPGKKAVFGMKATFSALITFTHPDRKASEEEAVTALLGELKRRLKAC
ncbi:uncharacterized protein LOC133116245 isoform X2 [Conger conger]|uniref:uncharacterized protein LOC133116245 isoform X2 n=1 Tax=Conger conger TaxID=82655 RepID=UPI002A5A3457|nr:uncharacterized protein LOC133116245 isoform X2 [Conger conger]